MPRLIGQLIEKQVDGVRPAETFLLPPENGDPPRWQAVVSSANAKRHAAPRFCEGSRHCRRHDCDSKAVGDKLHGGMNIAYLEHYSALDAMLRKYFIDEPSEGAVGRQIDEDLLGKHLERHQAARGQWVIAWANRDERIMHKGMSWMPGHRSLPTIAWKLRSISPDRTSPGTVSVFKARTDTSTIGNAERNRFKRGANSR